MPFQDIALDTLNKHLKNPWPTLAVSLSCAAIGLVTILSTGYSPVPLVAIGLIAAGAAIAQRPYLPAVLALAVATGFLSYNALPEQWDTMRLLVVVLTAFAAVGCLLMAIDPIWHALNVGYQSVPRSIRRAFISLLIVLHFGGIATAVLNVNPSPWLTGWLWSKAYRYYLEFFYLNNAYHFYAPEPGPATLVWCYVKYEDGTMQKLEYPKLENHSLTLCYQRRLSLAESVNQLIAAGQLPSYLYSARVKAGNEDGIPFYDGGMNPDPQEFRPPIPFSRRMIEAYARRAAYSMPHPTDPTQKVTGVKIYRVVHRLPNAKEIALGILPTEKWFYLPYYQGEYDAEGNLKDPNDPYLWWLIPITNVKDSRLSRGVFAYDDRRVLDQAKDIRDFFEVHLNLPERKTNPMDVPAIPGEPEKEQPKEVKQ